MKKIFSTAIIVLALAAALPAPAQTVNISGKWDATLDIQGTTVERSYTIEQTGDSIVVKWQKNGEENKAEGKVTGNKVEWTEIGNVNGSEIRIVATGTIEGNTMSGESDFGGQMTFTWKAVRKS